MVGINKEKYGLPKIHQNEQFYNKLYQKLVIQLMVNYYS